MKKLVSILFLVISVFSFSAWEYYEKEGTQGIKPIKNSWWEKKFRVK